MEDIPDFDIERLFLVCAAGLLALAAVFYVVARSTYRNYPSLRRAGIRPRLVTALLAALWLTIAAAAVLGLTSILTLVSFATLIALFIYAVYVWRRHQSPT